MGKDSTWGCENARAEQTLTVLRDRHFPVDPRSMILKDWGYKSNVLPHSPQAHG